jgi:hypothetical protein
MARDLEEVRERLSHVKKQIRSFRTLLFDYERSAVLTRSEVFGGELSVLSGYKTKPIPVSLRSSAGMIVNELRSCLDTVACTLAIRNNKTDNNTYFPISRSQDIFLSDGLRKIRNLSDSDKDRISSYRPYRGGHPHLYSLHEIDRTRKHRRLVTSSVRSHGVLVAGVPMPFGLGGNVFLRNCTVNGEPVDMLSFGPSNIEQDATPIAFGVGRIPSLQPVISVSYDEPNEIVGKPVSLALKDFSDTVGLIVKDFS